MIRMRYGAMQIAITAMVVAAVAWPVRAQPPKKPSGAPQASAGPRIPMPMLTRGTRDTELTDLVRDIVALRAINSMGITRDQIEKLIPVLQDIAAAEKRLREEAIRELKAERARLLAGTATAEQSRKTQAAIATARRAFTRASEQAKAKAATILTPEQMSKFSRLTGAAPRKGAAPTAAQGAALLAPGKGLLQGIGGGPSARVIQHVIGLLKAKLRAMQGSGEGG
jgi:hypothetical protein